MRFLYISLGSLAELETHFIIAIRLNYINNENIFEDIEIPHFSHSRFFASSHFPIPAYSQHRALNIELRTSNVEQKLSPAYLPSVSALSAARTTLYLSQSTQSSQRNTKSTVVRSKRNHHSADTFKHLTVQKNSLSAPSAARTTKGSGRE